MKTIKGDWAFGNRRRFNREDNKRMPKKNQRRKMRINWNRLFASGLCMIGLVSTIAINIKIGRMEVMNWFYLCLFFVVGVGLLYKGIQGE